MFRVLYLIDTLEVGGAEKSLLDMLPRFRNVEPILCHLYPGSALKERFQKAGIEVISLDLPKKYAFGRAIPEVRRLIKERQIAMVHASLMRADIVSRIAGQLEAVPIVNTLVSDTYSAAREKGMLGIRRWKHRGMYLIDRLTAPLATKFVANSQAVKKASCKALGIKPSKVDVIYRGRDVQYFLPSTKPGRQVILCVGRLLSSKGQDELLRAMLVVKERHPKASLLIAGEGPYRTALENLITDLNLSGTVSLLGTRDDIPQLLQTADLFVSPSHLEGLPGAVVEAMLAGVPVILADIDVHREMITDGHQGRLIPLHDVSALSSAIIELLEDPAQASALSDQARKKALDAFDIEKIVVSHETLYAKLLSQAK